MSDSLAACDWEKIPGGGGGEIARFSHLDSPNPPIGGDEDVDFH
jgi:hypothetical protein